MSTAAATTPSRRRSGAVNDAQFALPFDGAATTPTLADAQQLGRAGMALAQVAAGSGFVDHAKTYVLGYLARHKRASSELLTDACKLAGIKPAGDDRAFGAVYASLQRDKAIQKVDSCKRRKGHGSAGGHVWALSGAVAVGDGAA